MVLPLTYLLTLAYFLLAIIGKASVFDNRFYPFQGETQIQSLDEVAVCFLY